MGIATCWYSICNTTAIKHPLVLHLSTALEVGDSFLNKYVSTSHEGDVLQVWLLQESKEKGYCWTQVYSLYIHHQDLIAIKLPGFW